MITDDSRKLLKEGRSANVWIQMVLDHLVVQSLLYIHTYIRIDDFSNEYRILAVITFLLMTVIYRMMGVYQRERNNNDYLTCLLQAWGCLVLVLSVFGFITKTSETFSREVILTWAATGFFGQLFIYYLSRKVLQFAISETIPTLIIGGNELGLHIARHINNNAWVSDVVVGVVDANEALLDEWQKLAIPLLGDYDHIAEAIMNNGIRRVYIALPMAESEKLMPLALSLVDANVDVIWAPDIFGISLLNHSIKEMAGVPLISLSETPLVGASALAKASMDRVLAILAIIVISPIMLVTAVAVKVTSPGPVLFKQKRHGWDGRIVEIYKFRSMKVHIEKADIITQATRNDNRITPIGKFIRRTSIDELPQLFNVIGGSMSLVGPRPHALAHNDYYKGKIGAYMMRHRIKPGLTGLAQVNGFRGETDTIDKMQSRVNYDIAYINNWSIWLDFEIMFRTVFVLLGKNAY
ncbi:MAG: undecaprenyl-phosphate glucose phosphotransferase [Pseudomonadales bacterium]|nr:undecaprenyl-phosphate glucose phosphotransferase [Pseudomonadales bacterium]